MNTEFTGTITKVWEDDGRPSTRTVARRTHPRIGHVTVCELLYGIFREPVPWETTESVVRALNGDPDAVRPVWEAAGGS